MKVLDRRVNSERRGNERDVMLKVGPHRRVVQRVGDRKGNTGDQTCDGKRAALPLTLTDK